MMLKYFDRFSSPWTTIQSNWDVMLQLLPCKLLLIVDSMMVTDIDGNKAPMMRSMFIRLASICQGGWFLFIYIYTSYWTSSHTWMHRHACTCPLVWGRLCQKRSCGKYFEWPGMAFIWRKAQKPIFICHRLSQVITRANFGSQLVSTDSLQVLRHRNNTWAVFKSFWLLGLGFPISNPRLW